MPEPMPEADFSKLSPALPPFPAIVGISNPCWEVPLAVAVCPECGGSMVLEVIEWDAELGEPTKPGCDLSCRAEMAAFGAYMATESNTEEERNAYSAYVDAEHNHFQSDWQPAIERVYDWARLHVRVPVGEKS